MIRLHKVKDVDGNLVEIEIQGQTDHDLDGQGRLTVLPALVDPHVHFRTPGAEHKENWESGARAALAGGVTTVFDMPNNDPPCVTAKEFENKCGIINSQLSKARIPLRYQLFFGADQDHLDQLPAMAGKVAGIKVFMGSSTGGLVMTDPDALEEVFRIAAENDLLVAVHAEDEERLQERAKRYQGDSPALHSVIRDRLAAVDALGKALRLAEKYNVRLYALHLSTVDELRLIREAKGRGVRVIAETTPHHLFFNEDAYTRWGTRVQVNPPIRTEKDQEALWKALVDGTIDIVASDHAPHTAKDKAQPYPHAPSGVPGIETRLPLMIEAVKQGRLTLPQVVKLVSENPRKLFGLPETEDVVLVDLDKPKTVDGASLKSKCGWSPFAGMALHGWPEITVCNGALYYVDSL